MKVMFNNRGLMLMYEETTDTYIIQSPKTERQRYDNPLTAWSDYITMLDVIVRRQIGDKFESENKNRYTGEPETAVSNNNGFDDFF